MSNFLPVLNSEIPAGGRNLTSAECKNLRKHGESASPACKVMPNGSAHYGSVYRPSRTSPSSVWNTRIAVTTK